MYVDYTSFCNRWRAENILNSHSFSPPPGAILVGRVRQQMASVLLRSVEIKYFKL